MRESNEIKVQLAVCADPAAPCSIRPAGRALAGRGAEYTIQAASVSLLGTGISLVTSRSIPPPSRLLIQHVCSSSHQEEGTWKVRGISSSKLPIWGFRWPQQLCKLTRAQEPSLKTLTTQRLSKGRGFSGQSHISSLSVPFSSANDAGLTCTLLYTSVVPQTCDLGSRKGYESCLTLSSSRGYGRQPTGWAPIIAPQ